MVTVLEGPTRSWLLGSLSWCISYWLYVDKQTHWEVKERGLGLRSPLRASPLWSQDLSLGLPLEDSTLSNSTQRGTIPLTYEPWVVWLTQTTADIPLGIRLYKGWNPASATPVSHDLLQMAAKSWFCYVLSKLVTVGHHTTSLCFSVLIGSGPEKAGVLLCGGGVAIGGAVKAYSS